MADIMVSPTADVAARRMDGAAVAAVTETLATETAVAMHFNGLPHAVMMATPADLEDFGLGFALTEGIVRRADELTMVEQTWTLAADSPYFCVEPWMGPPNAAEHKVGLHFVAPGATEKFTVSASVK